MIEDNKKEKIRETGRNFNEEFMVNLWQTYHFQNKKSYKFLYYDPIEDKE